MSRVVGKYRKAARRMRRKPSYWWAKLVNGYQLLMWKLSGAPHE